MVAVVKEKTFADKLFSVEAKALVSTLANTLAETEMQRLRLTLADLEAKALVDTMRDNSGEGRNILQHSRRGGSLGSRQQSGFKDSSSKSWDTLS